jgi:hypothetical protein
LDARGRNYIFAKSGIRWNNGVVINFISKVDEALQFIASNPEAFPVHNTVPKIRKCVVTPQITVYYHVVNAGNIDLLTFWNNYQDPDKLKLR